MPSLSPISCYTVQKRKDATACGRAERDERAEHIGGNQRSGSVRDWRRLPGTSRGALNPENKMKPVGCRDIVSTSILRIPCQMPKQISLSRMTGYTPAGIALITLLLTPGLAQAAGISDRILAEIKKAAATPDANLDRRRGITYEPAYDGSRSSKIGAVPIISYTGNNLFVRTTEGILEGGVRAELLGRAAYRRAACL